MPRSISTHFTIETEQEEDGRWIADILEIPGVLVYGLTQLKEAKKTVVGWRSLWVAQTSRSPGI